MNRRETYPKISNRPQNAPLKRKTFSQFFYTVTICTFVHFCKISWKKLTNFEEIH